MTGPDTNGHDTTGDRVDIIEAARRLGITTDAVRKRIHRGLLAGERVGGRWYVVLPVSGHVVDLVQDTTDDILVTELRAQIALLERGRDDFREIIARQHERITVLEGQLQSALESERMERYRYDENIARLTQRIPQLPERATPPAETESPSPAEAAPPRPWWQVWKR